MYTHVYIYTHIKQYTHTHEEIYLKELVPMMVGAGKFEICSAGLHAGNSGRSSCCSFEAEFLLLREISVFAHKAFN